MRSDENPDAIPCDPMRSHVTPMRSHVTPTNAIAT